MIRTAGPDGAAAVAALHAASWRSAYAGFAPAAYLAGAAVERDLATYWQGALAAPPSGSFLLLDEEAASLRAFISIKLAVEPGYDAFVYALHVDPVLRGGGIGRLLLGVAMERLVAAGHRSAALRAFDGNPGAIRFYRRLGGAIAGHGFDEVGGVTFPDTLIGWRDLPALVKACH